ncbi:hypothetical protein [Myxosarcina sp. GI1]|uniref:hypothetical protein n=1 Tax=Myxosarcina sp. GI1 TaxID=1541065 RepID=UPI0005611240|nr:hypothetical protein [Myxosarcina sp. GI1]
MSNIDKITANEELFTELTPKEGAMIEGGQFTILIRDVGPARAAAPLAFKASQIQAQPNPTVLQITNGTGYNLNFGLDFDAPNAGSNLSIAPNAVQNFLGQNPKAIVKHDLSLLLPGSQEIATELNPGRRYEFYEV